LHGSFVHTIRELQGSDSTLQASVDLNKPFHLNWASLPQPISKLVISKQHVHLTSQTMTPKKTLEEILKDISTQVLELSMSLTWDNV
jgi:hypothetical protein